MRTTRAEAQSARWPSSCTTITTGGAGVGEGELSSERTATAEGGNARIKDMSTAARFIAYYVAARDQNQRPHQ
jgi:hypothetical protein